MGTPPRAARQTGARVRAPLRGWCVDISQRVDEITEDAEALLLVRLGDDAGAVEHGLRGEDGRRDAHGEGDGVGGARVDLEVVAARDEHDAGAICLVSEVRDDDVPDADAEVRQDAHEQVVGERALGLHALELHGDRLRLPAADPDGQVALAVGFPEDDDVLRGEHVDADALHDHLAQSLGHGDLPAHWGLPARWP